MADINSNNDKIFQEYLREIKRLNKFIEQETKKGFIFPKNIIPETPKTITKSTVDKLQKITPDKLYQLSTYRHPNTGEIISGVLGKQIEQKMNRKKSTPPKPKISKSTPSDARPQEIFVMQTLKEISERIDGWEPLSNWSENLAKFKERDRNTLKNLLEGAIAQQGKKVVARRCEENADILLPIVDEILYASGDKEGNFKDGRTQVNFDLVRFSQIITGRALTAEESIDLTEDVEDLGVYN